MYYLKITRAALSNMVATSHMWLLSIRNMCSLWRCAISIDYTKDFEDPVQKNVNYLKHIDYILK